MNKIILSKLKNSIGKRLKFRVSCLLVTNYDKLQDIFYATLLSVNDDYIVVEQTFINIDKDGKVNLDRIERTLYFDKFEIDKETPLSH